jgi:hypothetical protein
MARQRAGQASAAFARVGTAPVGELPASDTASEEASISASGNDSESAIISDVLPGSEKDGNVADDLASPPAVPVTSRQAGRKTGRKTGKRRRRVGRPRGPERVPLTVRILAATDERLTAAVEATGKSPQYIVDEALNEYLSRIEARPATGNG